MSGGGPKVLYIAMPFASVAWASLGLGTLKAIGEERGIAADVRYLNVPFARAVGPRRYKAIAEIFDAEIVFTACLFPDVSAAAVWEGYAELYRRGAGRAGDEEGLSASREDFLRIATEHAPRLLASALDEIPWDDYDVVGFTTGFHQTVSSLALARRIRERHPEKILLFGGAGCDGDMGPTLLKHFEFLDVVVSGEADTQIVPLIEALRQGQPANRWPGVYARASERVAVDTAGPSIGPSLYGRPWTEADAGHKVDPATLPIPDYDDYFAQIAGCEIGEDLRIPFESSRGCWWGQKVLCTFCGLNGTSLAYRAKPPERVLREIEALYSRYGQRRFMATDNILDMRFLETLLPGLRELHRRWGIELFYEVKSNLRTDQVRRLREAGVSEIQPGIESFSDHVLELMQKGTTGLNQVRFLRDCNAVGLIARYGILWGNPGETAEDYRALRRLLPFIHHLTPPKYVQPIALERSAPISWRPRASASATCGPTTSTA
jgi:ribosomal peptide maturation radical SAM protein 1